MNPKAYTSKEMSKRLAEAGLFQDSPEAWWIEHKKGKFGLYPPNQSPYPWSGLQVIAVPLWRLLEELPFNVFIDKTVDNEWSIGGSGSNLNTLIIDKNLPDVLAFAHLKLAERKTK